MKIESITTQRVHMEFLDCKRPLVDGGPLRAANKCRVASRENDCFIMMSNSPVRNVVVLVKLK